MEEPENGIHPANLAQVVELVHELAVDTSQAPGPGNPMRQVIVNTHSPGVVKLVGHEDLLYARQVPTLDGVGEGGIQLLPIRDSWRAELGGPVAGAADLIDYLTMPPGQSALFNIVA